MAEGSSNVEIIKEHGQVTTKGTLSPEDSNGQRRLHDQLKKGGSLSIEGDKFTLVNDTFLKRRISGIKDFLEEIRYAMPDFKDELKQTKLRDLAYGGSVGILMSDIALSIANGGLSHRETVAGGIAAGILAGLRLGKK